MNRYEIPLPVPSKGINYTNENTIDDSRCAYGTKNMSFKNGIPVTRRGYKEYIAMPGTSVVTGMTISAIESIQTYRNTQETELIIMVMTYVVSAVAKRGYFYHNGTSWNHLYSYTISESTVLSAGLMPTMCSFTSGLTPVITGYKTIHYASLPHKKYQYYMTAYTVENGESKSSNMLEFTISDNLKRIKITAEKIKNATYYYIYMRHTTTDDNTWTDYYKFEIESADETYAHYDKNYVFFYDEYGLDWGSTVSFTPALDVNFVPYSSKMLILDDGQNMEYSFHDASGLQVVPSYNPNAYEIAAYGENTMIIAPDEVNKQRFMVTDNNRLWLGGYQNIVRMSHLLKFNYFPSTFVWKMDENVTGMSEYMGEVVVFTKNTATLITGSSPSLTVGDTYKMYKLPVEAGVLKNYHIATGDNCLYWVNKRGVFRYTSLPAQNMIPQQVSGIPQGESIPERISEFSKVSIMGYLNEITNWDLVNCSYYDGQFRIMFGDGKELIFTANNGSWEYNEYNDDLRRFITQHDKLICASDKKIFEMNIYDFANDLAHYQTDDGAEVEYVLKSKYFDFEKSANKKKFVKFFITFTSNFNNFTLDLIPRYDNGADQSTKLINNKKSLWGSLAFGDIINITNSVLNFAIKLAHKGRRYNFQYELRGKGVNMDYSVANTTLITKIKELK